MGQEWEELSSNGKVHVQKLQVREGQVYISSCKWMGVNGAQGTERMGERLEKPQALGLVDHAKDLGHYPKSNGKLMKGLKQRGDHQGSLLQL